MEYKRVLFLCSTILFLFSCNKEVPIRDNLQRKMKTSPVNQSNDQQYVPNEYIVTIKREKTLDYSRIRDNLNEFSVERIQPIVERLYLIKLRNDPGIDIIEQKLKQLDFIDDIQRNFKYQTDENNHPKVKAKAF